MQTRILASLLTGILTACAAPTKRAAEPVDTWVEQQEAVSWGHLQKNISPTEPKVPGGPKPRAGIVVAALHKKDPDYYFHWVRDSANVMRVVVDRYRVRAPQDAALDKTLADFIDLSLHLQDLSSPYGLGDPRYTDQGEVDTIKWSRPQYDGPALRAISVMQYLEKASDPALRKRGEKLVRRDLDFLVKVWDQRSFDIWEELRAENYHTRVVQLGALERGAKLFKNKTYAATAARIENKLNDHWDPTRSMYRSQLAIEATDGYTTKQTDLDSAVLVAVLESDRVRDRHSVLDDRLHATVARLEKFFRGAYPINREDDLGLGYGRYPNDSYYGGNPWFLVTAYYAQFYFRLAAELQGGAEFRLTPLNREFVLSTASKVVPKKPTDIVVFRPQSEEHQTLVQEFVKKGDLILARLRAHTPPDGQLYEQFDKNTGSPTSSRGIGWSHSALIAASLERSRVKKP